MVISDEAKMQSALAKIRSALQVARGKMPAWQFNDEGAPAIVYDGEFKTSLARYGVWLSEPVLKTTDAGDISVWIECNVPGCAKSTGFKLATLQDTNANIGNWFKHAQHFHPWLLIAADQPKSGNQRPALAAAGGGAAERGAPMLTDEEERDARHQGGRRWRGRWRRRGHRRFIWTRFWSAQLPTPSPTR